MIGVILVGHGGLASCFLNAIEHIVGPQTHLVSVGIHPDDDLEAKRQHILEKIKEIDDGEGVIIVTDMFGGTPSNLAMSLLDLASIDVIAGMNLPMLVKIMSHRQEKLPREEVMQLAEEAGRKYVMVASHLMKKDESKD